MEDRLKEAETELQRKAREAKNAYRREWIKKHPGKNSEYSANYWMKKVRETEERKNDGS